MDSPSPPSSSRPPGPGDGTSSPLKVGSLNVWQPGPDWARRKRALAGMIRDAGVQLVLLQELANDDWLHDLADLSELPQARRVGSVGIISRLPLSGSTPYKVRRTPSPLPLEQLFKFWYVPFLGVRLSYEGRTYHVFSNHWDHRDNVSHQRELQAALRTLARLPQGEPVIFGGDLNIHAEESKLQPLRTGGELEDAFQQVPGAHHCNGDSKRIDIILLRGLEATSYRAECLEQPVPTDHPFVVVELKSAEPVRSV